MVMKKILIALALLLTGIASGSACTGISFLAEDGGYVQARTIEWGDSYLPSEYVIVPRGQDLVSYTPTGVNGLRFRAKYGLVGLAIIQKEFVAEGLNEVGLSAGLFYFPHYGKYEEYDEAQNAITLSDLQVVNWMLSQFATIDEVREAIEGVKVVSLDKPGKSSTVHWRIGDAKGNQMVLEFVGGVPYFYENKVGVLTNSPDFPWDVVSHDSNTISSTPIDSSASILLFTSEIDVVGIDEAQFFDSGLIDVCNQLANNGVRVIIAGLDMDFKGIPFGPMPALCAIADEVSKVHAICVKCGQLASFSHRTVKNDKQVLLGETAEYEPLCRECYQKALQEDKEKS